MQNSLSPGCELCLRGAKLVLFVTGICDRSCYYCPLGESRKGRDVVYADEVLVGRDLDIILEARAIDAEGTGITGGDPILRLTRTLHYVKILKEYFGQQHHIHLYTNGRHVSREVLIRLKEAGLDELRFHPALNDWGKIALAKRTGIYTGAEVPAIPGEEKVLRNFVLYLDRVKADFLNVNQLEFCPPNAYQLRQRGFCLDGDSMTSVHKSEDTAIALIDWATNQGLEIPIHYCSSAAKDRMQMGNRFIRRSRNVAHPYEATTEEGLLSKLTVPIEGCAPKIFKASIAKKLNLEPYMLGLSAHEGFIEAPETMLSELKKITPTSQISYVQEYPTVNRERFAEYPC